MVCLYVQLSVVTPLFCWLKWITPLSSIMAKEKKEDDLILIIMYRRLRHYTPLVI